MLTAAGEHGDGLVVTSPSSDVIEGFRSAGGSGRPIYGQATMCWAPSADEAKETLHRIWPNVGIPGDLSQELPLPMHFEQAASNVTPEALAEKVPVGPDLERYVTSLREYVDAGIDHVYLHQVGPDQEGFFRFFRDELRPELERLAANEPVPV